MALKTSTLAIFLSINFLFSSLVTSTISPIPQPSSLIPTLISPSSPLSRCSKDALKLGICTNLLGKLIGVQLGDTQKKQCCTLINGLVDLEISVCLCTAIKANILGINLSDIPIVLNLVLGACGKSLPVSFKCDFD